MTNTTDYCLLHRDRECNYFLDEFGTELLNFIKNTTSFYPPDECLERAWEGLLKDTVLFHAFANKSKYVVPVVQFGFIYYITIDPQAVKDDCAQFYSDQFGYYCRGEELYLGSDWT